MSSEDPLVFIKFSLRTNGGLLLLIRKYLPLEVDSISCLTVREEPILASHLFSYSLNNGEDTSMVTVLFQLSQSAPEHPIQSRKLTSMVTSPFR